MDVRTQAATVLANILRQRGSLATLLPDAALQVNARDRPLLHELCYGVCRWQPRLEKFLQQLVQKPPRAKDADIHALLLLGLYQLVYLRVPDHAALSATVDAAQHLKKPWAKKLINGVLREFLRQWEKLEQDLQNDAVFQSAHPLWLLQLLRQAWPDYLQDIISANNQPPPFTVRVNQSRCSRDDYLRRLNAHGISAEPTPYSAVGLTVIKPIAAPELPGFREGLVSVQDEAPQLTPLLLRCEPHHRVLDACSAPGGKTAHLLEHLPNLSLVALDISEQRMQRIRENLQRLNLHAALVVGNALQPSTWWDGQAFDRILLDAPCSATGIVRRQPDIKILRTPESLAKLVNTQSQLLTALWPLLKRGGELLYATCAILPEENSQLVMNFVREQNDARHEPIDAEWGMDVGYGRQLLPQARGHDGFYFARLIKT